MNMTKEKAMLDVVIAAKDLILSAGMESGQDMNGDATFRDSTEIFCVDGKTTLKAREELIRAIAEWQAAK